MTLLNRLRALIVVPVILVACSHPPATSPGLPPAAGIAQEAGRGPRFVASDKIKHIVFIVQENRTFDNIFGGFPSPLPGADAATTGVRYDGKVVDLTNVKLENPGLTTCCDPNNYHAQWLNACNPSDGPPFTVGGPSPCRMNGFTLNASPQPGYPDPPVPTYEILSYVNHDETQPYWFIAQHYAVGDRFFMGHNSESYTAHQYIFSSQSDYTVDAPVFPSSLDCNSTHLYCAYVPWGCDSPTGTHMYLLDPVTGIENGLPAPPDPKTRPCFGTDTKIPYYSIADRMHDKDLTWRLYARSMCSGIVGLDANKTIRKSDAFEPDGNMGNCYANYGFKTTLGSKTLNFRIPEYIFPNDEAAGKTHIPLASMTWVLPGPITSDHPGVPFGFCGPTWVASVINAIGNSPDWSSTAIFVFWDDWGGFYDHVAPYVVRDQAGPGFRVPLLVVSPYVRRGVIHANAEFATLNKFVETTFGLKSLNASDASPYVNNLNDFFDFNQPAQKFTPVPYPGFTTCKSFQGVARHSSAPEPRWLRLVGADRD